MCRFLLVRLKEKIKPEKLLNQFASICEKSHAPDGDWQGDGWGIAIKVQSSKFKVQKWDEYKSLTPIWEEKNKFQQFKPTNMFVVHARSAGFPQDRGVIEYNQPYISDDLCFVFNGMIKGVNIDRKLEGKIGAQKILSLIQDVILTPSLSRRKNPPRIKDVLRVVDQLIINNSKKVIGMNIGIVKNNRFYVICEYENNPEYFGIRYFQDSSLSLVCSEPIGSFNWQTMQKSEIVIL